MDICLIKKKSITDIVVCYLVYCYLVYLVILFLYFELGITIPTLHVGMLFTTGCWYRDPHSFPWIEYLHTGASKIW